MLETLSPACLHPCAFLPPITTPVRKIPVLPHFPLEPPTRSAKIPPCRSTHKNSIPHQPFLLSSPGLPGEVAAKLTEGVFLLLPPSPTTSSKTSSTPPSPPSPCATSTIFPSSNSPTCSNQRPTAKPSPPSSVSRLRAPISSPPNPKPSPLPASPTSSKTSR
jgi:hypothetical protein